jgi:hypothetical protein
LELKQENISIQISGYPATRGSATNYGDGDGDGDGDILLDAHLLQPH